MKWLRIKILGWVIPWAERRLDELRVDPDVSLSEYLDVKKRLDHLKSVREKLK